MNTKKRIDGDYYIETINADDRVYIQTNSMELDGNLTVSGNITYITMDLLLAEHDRKAAKKKAAPAAALADGQARKKVRREVEPGMLLALEDKKVFNVSVCSCVCCEETQLHYGCRCSMPGNFHLFFCLYCIEKCNYLECLSLYCQETYF